MSFSLQQFVFCVGLLQKATVTVASGTNPNSAEVLRGLEELAHALRASRRVARADLSELEQRASFQILSTLLLGPQRVDFLFEVVCVFVVAAVVGVVVVVVVVANNLPPKQQTPQQ